MKTIIRCIEPLLFAGLIAFLLMAGIPEADAQPRDRGGRNGRTDVVKKLPKKHSTVRVNGNRFFYSKGAFYGKSRRGYTIVDAPIGAVVRRLPRSNQVIWIGGQKYFVHNGVFYVKVRRGFKVVAFPWHVAASWSGIGIGSTFFIPGFAYRYSPAHKTYRIAAAKKRGQKMNTWNRTVRRRENRRFGNRNNEQVRVAPNRQARDRTAGRRSN